MPPGAKITERDIAPKAIANQAIPEGAMVKKEEIVGQRTRFGLAAGDIIRGAHLAAVANSEVPQKVAAMGDTYRAVMIQATLVPGNGRLVAGDRLELLAVMQIDDGPKSSTKVLPLGMATVLDSPQPGSGQADTILIALRAEEVAKYALAQRTGTIVVAVPGQDTTQSVPVLNLSELTGAAPADAQPGAPATAQTKPPGR